MNETKLLFDTIINQGQDYFDSILEQPTIETDLSDFKESSSDNPKALHVNDRRNLSKAIGGFANTDGGIIVWGVKCRKDESGRDKVLGIVPLSSPKDFAALLYSNTNVVVQPPAAGVKHEPVLLPNGTGFVVTYGPAARWIACSI